jgi:hypothetical protein
MATMRKYYSDIVVNNLKVSTIQNAQLITTVNGDMLISNIAVPAEITTLSITAADKLQLSSTGTLISIDATTAVAHADVTAATGASTAAVTVAGGVGVAQRATLGSILFPPFNVNPGTALSLYSEYTLASTWTLIWAVPKAFNLYITEVGNAVFYYAPYVSGITTANNWAESTASLPAAYIPHPSSNHYSASSIITKGANRVQGCLQVSVATGKFYVHAGTSGTKWLLGELAGIRIMNAAVKAV